MKRYWSTIPATDKSVALWSDDPSIATVNNNGLVTGKSLGTTDI